MSRQIGMDGLPNPSGFSTVRGVRQFTAHACRLLMNPSPLDLALRRCATDQGADFFGVADLEPHRAAFARIWPVPLTSLRYGISIGIALNRWIVDRLAEGSEPYIANLYRQECYTIVNERLDFMALRLASEIDRAGFQAAPIPATSPTSPTELVGPFTHKAVARLSGLGWIGRSCLLVTPQAGPRVRWASVLTDAPLQPTGRPIDNGCDDCSVCVEVCPVQAFTGRIFHPSEPVAMRYDTRLCQAHLAQVQVCGLCLAACPQGRQRTPFSTNCLPSK